ncbi:MAG: hypothetical protein ABI686_15425 [Acidobacteriota bacterium]
MNDEIVKLLAERYYHDEDISDWAIKCLEKEYDSRSLRMLASMPESLYSSSETEQYFRRVLEELSWDQIKTEEYLMRYAKILAGEIIENKIDPIKASRDIYAVFQDLDYPSELHDWHTLNEMVWDYDYFLKTGTKGHWFRSKEQLIAEIKKASRELIDALIT